MKVLLGSGRLVTLLPEYGPDATMRAAELTDAPAAMSFADRQLFNIASSMVAVKCVQDQLTAEETDNEGKVTKEATYGSPQTQEDITKGESDGRGMLMAFRKFFGDQEWEQLSAAVTEAYRPQGKPLKPYRLMR